jgi:hypothetical protein
MSKYIYGMKLIQISYRTENWELEKLDLADLNLIVGKNAVGKTRTMHAIDALVKLLTTETIDSNLDCAAMLAFYTQDDNLLIYSFIIENGKISSERLHYWDKHILARSSDRQSSILNSLTGEQEFFSPPTDRLAIHTHRDTQKYPYIELLINWAKNSFGFKFGETVPRYSIMDEYTLLNKTGEISSLYKALPEENRENVLKNINATGYDLLKIDYQSFPMSKHNIGFLFILENGVEDFIPHFQLSQGMFRSLAIIIYVEYLINQQKPATIIIDDFCEGLDYERATKLGKLVFELCEANNIQLIVSSNDSFLMEVVDIKYWNVLQRKGSTVTGLNIKNNPELFQKFRFTGLANFDFFSSDFIEQNL